MKKLIIKNSEWLRGTGKDYRYYNGVLFHPVTKCYCVQGLYCREVGLTSELMGMHVEVGDIVDTRINVDSKNFGWLLRKREEGERKYKWNTDLGRSNDACLIEKINDDTDTTDAEKIKIDIEKMERYLKEQS